ncbi:biopolymer transporter ExbD [cf. Phormidesmis sp. LEGE 11477]|uniref:ExbD/TolR family protein n=1 Tax=cf. Phormidesmis sp. LEGE 11477 TaxID=1828680 RepID=UPI00187E68F4|nr:biopolymer transporter ExbD [cf. Phormidesmis sp. LEGE 11477]MBE9063740.1 biopolymer transporter ExbD [cf. Phormidesmis sp. LEGE 11477]
MKVDFNNRESDVQINILPMIDVIFCILTFFILAAVGLTRQQVIDLALPSVDNSVPLVGTSSDRLYVSIDSIGQIYIDTTPVQLQDLYSRLLEHQRTAPTGTIVLYASSSARYESVIKVLDLLRSVGGDRVALATLPNNASLDPTQGRDPNNPLGVPTPQTPTDNPEQPLDAAPNVPGIGDDIQIIPNPTAPQPGGGLPPITPNPSIPSSP